MNGMNHYLVFSLDGWQIALRLSAVDLVIWAVEVTPLPEAPDSVLGLINVGGRVVPAINMRRRFGLPERDIGPDDRFIIAHSAKRTIALLADAVAGVMALLEGEVIRAEKILPGMEYIEGVIRLPDGVALIHDLERFLSMEEARMLNGALEEAVDGAAQ